MLITGHPCLKVPNKLVVISVSYNEKKTNSKRLSHQNEGCPNEFPTGYKPSHNILPGGRCKPNNLNFQSIRHLFVEK